jgi:hypothetical protein
MRFRRHSVLEHANEQLDFERNADTLIRIVSGCFARCFRDIARLFLQSPTGFADSFQWVRLVLTWFRTF